MPPRIGPRLGPTEAAIYSGEDEELELGVPASGSGLLLESDTEGTDFLILEDGLSFLLLED